ncbi:hypothetical protein ACLMJK_009387 [Lecanora helva]
MSFFDDSMRVDAIEAKVRELEKDKAGFQKSRNYRYRPTVTQAQHGQVALEDSRNTPDTSLVFDISHDGVSTQNVAYPPPDITANRPVDRQRFILHLQLESS